MAYLALQPMQSDTHVSLPPVRTASRTKTFDRVLTPFKHQSSFDELPLLDISDSPAAAVHKQNVISNIAEVDGPGYDTESTFAENNGCLNPGIPVQVGLVNGLKARLKSAYRYLCSSGPANSSRAIDDGPENTRRRMPTGWRLGTWVCCSAVVLCIIVEVGLLIYAGKISSGRESGLIMEGNCEDIRELELWLLLPLNIVGTILIGTSNYVMQVVSAPDRKEIDRAHSCARPIAVAGVRFNDLSFGGGNGYRRGIWWILGISSLPIHFLLNVAVYSSVQASNTGVLVVSEGFNSDIGWGHCVRLPTNPTPAETVTCSLYQNYTNNQTLHLTRSQCLRQYSSGFQTNASSVIVVTNQQSSQWHTSPSAPEVPASVSYGMRCRENYKVCNQYSDYSFINKSTSEYECSNGYTETSDSNYNITYDPLAGSTSITLDFIPFCENKTNYTRDGRYLNSEIIPTDRSSANASYTIYDQLSFRQGDSLSSVRSIRALFSAFQYRYWAASNISGDYLRADYLSLLSNRDPRSWLCSRDDLEETRQCDPLVLQQKSEWLITPESMSVQECHVLPKKELCTLRYSLSILIITICFDAVKLLAMLAAVTLISEPLTTLGDIVESFLRVPDRYTEGRRVMDDDLVNLWVEKAEQKMRSASFKYTKARFGNEFLYRSRCTYCGKKLHSDRVPRFSVDRGLITVHRDCGLLPVGSPHLPEFGERSYRWLCDGGPWWTTVSTEADHEEASIVKPRRWFEVPSRSRWVWSSFLYLPAFALSIVYFAVNFTSLLSQQLLSPWTVGFAAPDPNSLLTGGLAGSTSIYGAAVVINAPQFAFSLLYFIFNATLTMMHTAHEWASFAVHRKALRVSSPRGQQRATYWLQLPWTYSIPLIIISGSMHWLLSRSLYVVKVDVYGYLGERNIEEDYFACGYSPIPALLLVFVLASMGFILGGLAFRWLPVGMPLVRLNSLAIAAACHPDTDEKDLELEPLIWGMLEGYARPDGKPHYSFSAKSVLPPQIHPAVAGTQARTSTKIWPFHRKGPQPRVKDLETWA